MTLSNDHHRCGSRWRRCKWFESHGCDSAINYKATANMTKAIRDVAPGEIDIYFENVAGIMLEAALNNMKISGRMAICGMVFTYNDEVLVPGSSNLVIIAGKSLKIQGFIVLNYSKYALEYFAKLGSVMVSGQLVH